MIVLAVVVVIVVIVMVVVAVAAAAALVVVWSWFREMGQYGCTPLRRCPQAPAQISHSDDVDASPKAWSTSYSAQRPKLTSSSKQQFKDSECATDAPPVLWRYVLTWDWQMAPNYLKPQLHQSGRADCDCQWQYLLNCRLQHCIPDTRVRQ